MSCLSDPVLLALLTALPPTVAAVGSFILGLINRKEIDRGNRKTADTKSLVESTKQGQEAIKQETEAIKAHLEQIRPVVDETQTHTAALRVEMNGKFQKLQETLLTVTADAQYAAGLKEGGRDQRDVNAAKALEFDQQAEAGRITGNAKRE